MSDNDKYLKEMWNKAENILSSSEYESSTIERFISKRSNSTAEKIKKMIYFDIVLKAVLTFVFIIDFFLYMGTTMVIAVCVTGIILLALLIFYQFKMLNRFSKIVDYGQSAKHKLASMLTYLKSDFFSTLLSISAGYPIMFTGGVLLYFYVAYGYVRPMDGIDIIVFSTFMLGGMVFNFFVNQKQVSYQIKHIETCLADLNDSSLEMVANNLELQRKKDITNKILLYILLAFGFALLMIVLKNSLF